MSNNNRPVVVTLGTYPPYEDGISTFTYDLIKAGRLLFEPEISFKVAAIDITGIKPEDYPEEVEWIVRRNVRADYVKAAEAINKKEDIRAVVIQHEYGIFGGDSGGWTGDFVLDFLQKLRKPLTLVLHTVLSNPPKEVREVTRKILDRADRLVVMSEHSSLIIRDLYKTDGEKIKVIPHGVHPILFEYPEQVKKREKMGGKLILATFGFLGSNKGIEYVIKSLPDVVKKYPNTEYWLIGRTHPLVQKEFGEKYRESLESLVWELGLKDHVRFFNRYYSVQEILKFLSMTDIYIATSLNPEQAVSGTFSYALGSGRCVISTSFAQAKEIIAHKNMGLLVDFKKPEEFTSAILHLLDHPRVRRRTQLRAYNNTRNMLWTNCALSHVYLTAKIDSTGALWDNFLPAINLSHFKRLSDNFGMIQFSKFKVPDVLSGYTIDDNARALLYCAEESSGNFRLLPMAEKFIRFIAHCQKEDGFFHNDISKSRERIAPHKTIGVTEDANARTLWALNVLRAKPKIPAALKEEAATLVKKFEQSGHTFKFPRAKAFYLTGLVVLAKSSAHPPEMLWRRIAAEADSLVTLFKENANGDWQWFEDSLTYANGILPAALLESFGLINNPEYREIGLLSLEHLIKMTFKGDVYVPIGQRGWHKRNKRRAEFDQQPEDPFAIIQALSAAHNVTGEKRYAKYAMRAFSWFLGNNILGVSLYDRSNGGCFDGLTKNGPNLNQGAESILSYLLSRNIIEKLLKNA